jgi:hypothetical protein
LSAVTLISTLVRGAVIQVGDRQLAKVQLSGRVRRPEVFDRASNKTVVYVARNGLLTISYSGAAYVDDVPTDEWIASRLSGFVRLERVMRFGRLPFHHDVGTAVLLLRQRLSAVRPRPSVEVIAGGWQWKVNRVDRPRPVLWYVWQPSDGSDYRVQYERWRHAPYPPFLAFVPRTVPVDVGLKRATARVVYDPGTSTEEATAALVNLNAEASRASELIGPDCMVVELAPPPDLSVRVEYITGSRRPDLADAVSGESLPAAFSPYLMGAREIYPPSSMIGVVPDIELSGHTNLRVPVVVSGPPAVAGARTVAQIDSQVRPLKP